MKRKIRKSKILLISALAALTLAGCGNQTSTSITSTVSTTTSSTVSSGTTSSGTSSNSTAVSLNTMLDTTDMFSTRDLEQTADLTGAEYITLTSGKDVTITKEGVYVISGNVTEVTITVEAAEDAKVQLVLNGVTITNTDAPAIYAKTADKVFVTTAASSTNYLKVSDTFTADGDTNLDAVIFSKTDLILNGTGTLEVVSSKGNGITSKDDLKITGGTYKVTSALDGFEATYIQINDGTVSINASDDGINASKKSTAYDVVINLNGGNITIVMGSGDTDAVDANGSIYVNGGTINITAQTSSFDYDVEGKINGGSVTVNGTAMTVMVESMMGGKQGAAGGKAGLR